MKSVGIMLCGVSLSVFAAAAQAQTTIPALAPRSKRSL